MILHPVKLDRIVLILFQVITVLRLVLCYISYHQALKNTLSNCLQTRGKNIENRAKFLLLKCKTNDIAKLDSKDQQVGCTMFPLWPKTAAKSTISLLHYECKLVLLSPLVFGSVQWAQLMSTGIYVRVVWLKFCKNTVVDSKFQIDKTCVVLKRHDVRTDGNVWV